MFKREEAISSSLLNKLYIKVKVISKEQVKNANIPNERNTFSRITLVTQPTVPSRLERWRWWKYFKSDYVCSSMYTVLLGAASPAHSLPYSLSNANEFTVGPLCRLLLAAHSGSEWLKSAINIAVLQTFLTNSQQFCSSDWMLFI